MKKTSGSLGALIIGSAIIWAAVIIGCSWALGGTDCYPKIQNILAGGVIAHIVVIWGPTVILFRKMKDGSSKPDSTE